MQFVRWLWSLFFSCSFSLLLCVACSHYLCLLLTNTHPNAERVCLHYLKALPCRNMTCFVLCPCQLPISLHACDPVICLIFGRLVLNVRGRASDTCRYAGWSNRKFCLPANAVQSDRRDHKASFSFYDWR